MAIITGTIDNDRLYGNDNENDSLFGDAGDDTLNSDTGSDIINGGTGFDYYSADYSSATSGLTMTYDPATGNGTIIIGSEVDTLISIESFNGGYGFFGGFTGTAFDDVIVGTSDSEDYLYYGIHGGAGNDTVSGGAGNDTVSGDEGNDVINGNDDNDRLFGGDGNDVLNGDAGDDILNRDTGSDTINGGTGFDYYSADYSSATSGLTMTYDTATGNGTIVVGSEVDTLISIESFNGGYGFFGGFTGTAFDDVIFGTADSESYIYYGIYGGAGNDTISGNAGNDNLYGEEGNDILNGNADSDRLSGGAGNDVLNGNVGDDLLSGDEGNDTLNGNAGFDDLYGNEGNDTLNGGTDNDYLEGGIGTDSLDGGTGNDYFYDYANDGSDVINGGTGFDSYRADYSGATSGLTMTYNSATGSGTITVGTDTNTFTSIENFDGFRGGDFNDVIVGTANSESSPFAGLRGGAGNDLISGNAGNDNLYGDEGNDTLNGGNDIDYLEGGLGNDSLNGDAGDDRFSDVADDGSDTINGGTGFDFYQADYSSATSGLTMTYNSATGSGTITVGADTNTFTSIENFDGFRGSDFNDVIVGTANSESFVYAGLRGGAGNDIISGNAGDDNLYGDDGNDTLNGGTENDYLEGGLGNDSLNGDAGDDRFSDVADDGSDTINGGTGFDFYQADYSSATSGLTMTYNNTTGSGTITVGADTNTFTSIENFDGFRGSDFNDVIVGTANSESYVYAGLRGGAGNDIISGNAGDDNLYGDDGNDTLNGGTENDYLEGGLGNDSLNGGNGSDNLIGEVGNDKLNGNQSNDILDGGDGKDRLTGANIATFGVGEIDTLTGGIGADTFILASASGVFYSNSNNADAGLNDYALITDLNAAVDKIQLKNGLSYILGTAPASLGITGTGIFIDNDGIGGLSANDELIGVLQGVTLTPGAITPGTTGFTFV